MFPSYLLIVLSLYAASICSLPCLNDHNFHDPPPDHRPKFRYWLPDASISHDVTSNDIREAKAVGAGGLEILPFYLYGFGEASLHRQAAQRNTTWYFQLPDWAKYGFGTPAFVDLFQRALEVAEESGLLLDFAVGANQGQGVPSEVLTAGLAVELLMSDVTINPGQSFAGPVPKARQPSPMLLGGLNFMHPLEQFGTPNLTAVIAYEVLSGTSMDSATGTTVLVLNETSMVDLTSSVQAGQTLQWTPPDAQKTYKVFSFFEAYTNQRSCDGGPNATDFIGNGSWTVDHFSKAGASRITDFWDEHILSNDKVGSLLKSVGRYAWEDSIEMLAALYWTPGLLDKFRATKGYDMLPYLPVLFNASNSWNGDVTPYQEIYAFGNTTNVVNSRYQLDYRAALNEGYQEYLSHFASWAHDKGFQYSAQPAYNLPVQMLSDIPLLDAPEGESLGFFQLMDAYRQFSGPAHLANKSVISSELGAVNVPPFSLRIPDLLQQLKRSFAGGFTQHVLHGQNANTPYPQTTWPGYVTFFWQYTDMWNPVQPAWQHMKDALDYVARNQWVLRQGSPRVDVAFYLFQKASRPKAQYQSTNLEKLGFTYDYLGADNLASSDAFMANGLLGIPQYKAVISYQQTVMSVPAAEALVAMAAAGLPVVFIGSPPNQAYPVDASTNANLTETLERLLSGPNVHRLDTVDGLPALLSRLDIAPRVALYCSSSPVYPVLRAAADRDLIYLFNDQVVSANCTVRVAISEAVEPYVYDAWTGSQTPLLFYKTTNTTLTFSVSLQSNETMILALHHQQPSPDGPSIASVSGSFHSLSSNNCSQPWAIITGPTTFTSANGTTQQMTPSLPAATKLSTWNLVIQDWHSAPDRFAVETQVTNHTLANVTLVPWTQLDTRLQPVGGLGHYTTTFTAPRAPNKTPLVGILKLPLIQHTARVFLNGHALAPVDPVNPVLVLGRLAPGTRYELRIDVATTLFNRIKDEANETMVVGRRAGLENALYATRPYEGYGLVGDVVVVWGEEVVLS